MKKFAIRLAIFMIPVIAFIVEWEYGLSRMPNSYSIKRTQLEAQASEIKVLVLGNSHVLRGVNPGCFSMAGYNVANFQQSIFYDTRITLKYLNKMTSLKVVLIGISYPSLWYQVHDGNEAFRDYFYADYWNIRYPSLKWYDIHCYSKILQYGNEKSWEYALNGFKTDLAPGYMPDGWAVGGKQGPINDSAGYALMKTHKQEMKPGNFLININDIEMLLKELNRRKIQAVFFIPPYSEYYNKYMDKKRLKTIDSALNALCATYNCKWYDFHDDPRFSDSDFREVSHLNKDGAIKFSKIIDEEILKKYNAPDTNRN